MRKNTCPQCGKTFRDGRAKHQHLHGVHLKKHKRKQQPQHNGEESMASLFINGYLNRAMGIGNEDWLEEML